MPPLTQTHYTPRPLDFGKESRARWAVAPSGTVVVFVHGFGGGATDTWDEFADLLPQRPECRGHDLLFYGYESITRQATINAALLRDFLHRLATDPFDGIMRTSLRVDRGLDATFRYDRIVLVAHSLGAVVVREALIQAATDPKMRPWLHRVSLGFFAPAHSGARILPLAQGGLGSLPFNLGSLTISMIKANARVLADLEPGSPTIERLQRETSRLIAEGVDSLKAKFVVQGTEDGIIDAVVFCADPGPAVEIGRGHIDVCKPSVTYARPIEHLLPLLVP